MTLAVAMPLFLLLGRGTIGGIALLTGVGSGRRAVRPRLTDPG